VPRSGIGLNELLGGTRLAAASNMPDGTYGKTHNANAKCYRSGSRRLATEIIDTKANDSRYHKRNYDAANE